MFKIYRRVEVKDKKRGRENWKAGGEKRRKEMSRKEVMFHGEENSAVGQWYEPFISLLRSSPFPLNL